MSDYTRQQCADDCDANEECLAFEYGDKYDPKNCQLKSSTHMDGCDEDIANYLDLCIKNKGKLIELFFKI